jgi:hypothetical protein
MGSMTNPQRSSGIPLCTWVDRPANPKVGDKIQINDAGKRIMEWTGTLWVPANGQPWRQSGMPVGACSAGSFTNTTGAFTLITPFHYVYSVEATGGIYLYFPVGVIAPGSPAGVYYCIMSSTTEGVVYNNLYTGDEAVRPTVLVPMTSLVANWTQTGNEITLRTTPIYGKMLGPHGRIKISKAWTMNTTSANKFQYMRLGNALMSQVGYGSQAAGRAEYLIQNTGTTQNQFVFNVSNGISVGPSQVNSVAPFTNANTEVDLFLTSSVVLSWNASLGKVNDWIVDHGQTVEIYQG